MVRSTPIPVTYIIFKVVMAVCAVTLPVPSAVSAAWFWDGEASVYLKNCDPSKLFHSFETYNGDDDACTYDYEDYSLYFLDVVEAKCVKNHTGTCKMAKSWTMCDNGDSAVVSYNSMVLLLRVSGNDWQFATASSSSANCCAAAPGVAVSDDVCDDYFWDCNDKGINGAECAFEYVPCREAGGTEDECMKNL